MPVLPQRALVLLRALPALAIGVLLARAISPRFVFRGSHAATRARPVPAGFRLVTTGARDGVTVHALDLPAPEGAPMVVHFHNNRDTAADAADLARRLHARGLGVLLVEYRGYGLSSDADPSEEGLYDDAEAALDQLAARGVGADQVVLWGTSLGTGVAAEMARRGRGAALVLVAPYTSIPDVVTAAAPFVPAGLLLPLRFDTLDKTGEIRIPTLVIHGDEDEIIPFWMGSRLATAIHGARLIRVAGGHHGDLFLRDGERLIDAIRDVARGSSRSGGQVPGRGLRPPGDRPEHLKPPTPPRQAG